MALAAQHIHGGGAGLLLDVPDTPGLALVDLLLQGVGHRRVQLPYLVQVS